LTSDTNNIDSMAINEVQLILAEKRTSLAMMRTGIAVFIKRSYESNTGKIC